MPSAAFFALGGRHTECACYFTTPQEEDRGLGRGQHAGFLLARRGSGGGLRPAWPASPPAASRTAASVGAARSTACGLAASTISWNPPSPFIASTRPSTTVSAARHKACGPRANSPPCGSSSCSLRAAVGAGNRLGMEPPVGRIGVLGRAGRAHAEPGHAGPRTVVGQVLDDRPARPAVGAIGEGIAEPPLARRADLLAALGAGRQVGGDRRPGRPLVRAAADLESRLAVHLAGLRADVQRVDPCLGRRRAAQQVEERLDGGWLSLDLDPHHAGLVLHPAGQSAGQSGVIDEGPKPDPLDHSPHGDRQRARATTSWQRLLCIRGKNGGRAEERAESGAAPCRAAAKADTFSLTEITADGKRPPRIPSGRARRETRQGLAGENEEIGPDPIPPSFFGSSGIWVGRTGWN